jgi:hypothetical protein
MHRWLEGTPLEPFRNRCVVTKIFVARFVMGTVELSATTPVSDDSVKLNGSRQRGRRRSTHSAVLLLLQQITMALAF